MANPCAFAAGLVELASPACKDIATDDFCDRYFFRVAAAEYADSYTVRRCVSQATRAVVARSSSSSSKSSTRCATLRKGSACWKSGG